MTQVTCEVGKDSSNTAQLDRSGEVLPDWNREAARVNPAISRDEVLVVAKRSKLLRTQEKTKSSIEELVSHFSKLGEDGERTVSGHYRQEAAIEMCTEFFSIDQVVNIDDMLNALSSGKFKVVISLGGDDFFKLVSHSLPEEMLLLGVNSDPIDSRGFLLPVAIGELPAFVDLLEQGVYGIEEWTRIKVAVDGVECGTAINDIALGKKDFLLTSHFNLEYRGKKHPIASAGILVSTGTGSTGWFTNEGLYINHEDRTFPRTARKAAFELLTPIVNITEENGKRKISLPELVEGELVEGEVLKISSRNDDESVVARDSLERVPFQRGSVAEVYLDPVPAKVIVKYAGE